MNSKIRVRVGADDLVAAPFPRPAVTGFAGLFRRPASRWARAALVAVNLAAVAAFLVSYSRHGVGFGPYGIDLGVYRAGGRTWLQGGDLYRQVLVVGGLRLPFTYPPVAVVVLAPLALLPMAVAGTMLTVGSVAQAGVVLAVSVRRLAGPAAGSLWAAGWLLPTALLLEPVRSTHLVWCAPGLLTLADLGRRHRRRLAGAAAAGGLVLFAAAPQWWLGKFAGPEPRWAAWQQASGSSYVFFAALVLLLCACGLLTPQETTARTVPDPGHSALERADAALGVPGTSGRAGGYNHPPGHHEAFAQPSAAVSRPAPPSGPRRLGPYA